jgi:CHASE3 domain sensor protein
VFLLSMGVLMLFLVVMMSFLTFALIAQSFGDKKVSEKIEKSLPDFLK